MPNFEELFNIFLVPQHHQPAFPKPKQLAPDLAWLNRVRQDIVTISKTKVGDALFRSIKYHGIIVTIQPNIPGTCGDGTWPIDDDLHTGNPRLMISQGMSIWFSPEHHDLGHKCEARYKVFGQLHIESHEVLLHELVHAFRMASFRLDRSVKATKGFAFYDTREEIYAVLIQGIYASERGTGIRASHTRHFPIDPKLDSSLEFFRSGSEAFKIVENFCKENPGFTKMVAEVRTRFNPIRAYYCWRIEAKKMSLSKLARDRDAVQPVFKDLYEMMRHNLKKYGIASGG